ncbi:MAG: PAS domain S-box protein [Sneathiella sp.]
MEFLGNEVYFDPQDLIVSKTNLKGLITYANHTFLKIADYTEAEVIGRPHNLIRHPNMPRGIFELLWNKLQKGREIFAYVVNTTKSGDHYWVLAHVTPSFDGNEVVGFHSTRRIPDQSIIKNVIEPLYDNLNTIEGKHQNKRESIQASSKYLEDLLASKGVSYDEFVCNLVRGN